VAGRHVFFSFHYGADVWRASIVRNSGVVDATARAGFDDDSLWESVKKKGDAEIKRAINAGLDGTTVTAVLIGAKTATRPWVEYEIEQSIARNNGILGIYIHELKVPHQPRSTRGPVPRLLAQGNYKVYIWNKDKFRLEVERAAIDAGKPCLAHGQKSCFSCKASIFLSVS
jgi:hypothetical protein